MIEIGDLTYRYGKRAALRGVSLRIEEGEIFGFLGPNGSGKTTLFRVLSTLLSLQEGHVQIEGFDLRSEFRQIRRTIGVVFQYPSLDLKLTARENLIHQGHLYGLFGKTLHTRITTLLERFSLTERAGERVETFSGGMRRRLEIAKGLLHTPRILILDEPSTGLDPGARFDLWAYLRQLREEEDLTILVTTHLMEEAEHCDRLAILSQGELVALDTPTALKEEIGGEVILAQVDDPERLLPVVRERIDPNADLIDGMLRIECEAASAPQRITEMMNAFEDEIETITIRKPTLEDVFMEKTGHLFWENAEGEA